MTDDDNNYSPSLNKQSISQFSKYAIYILIVSLIFSSSLGTRKIEEITQIGEISISSVYLMMPAIILLYRFSSGRFAYLCLGVGIILLSGLTEHLSLPKVGGERIYLSPFPRMAAISFMTILAFRVLPTKAASNIPYAMVLAPLLLIYFDGLGHFSLLLFMPLVFLLSPLPLLSKLCAIFISHFVFYIFQNISFFAPINFEVFDGGGEIYFLADAASEFSHLSATLLFFLSYMSVIWSLFLQEHRMRIALLPLTIVICCIAIFAYTLIYSNSSYSAYTDVFPYARYHVVGVACITLAQMYPKRWLPASICIALGCMLVDILMRVMPISSQVSVGTASDSEALTTAFRPVFRSDWDYVSIDPLLPFFCVGAVYIYKQLQEVYASRESSPPTLLHRKASSFPWVSTNEYRNEKVYRLKRTEFWNAKREYDDSPDSFFARLSGGEHDGRALKLSELRQVAAGPAVLSFSLFVFYWYLVIDLQGLSGSTEDILFEVGKTLLVSFLAVLSTPVVIFLGTIPGMISLLRFGDLRKGRLGSVINLYLAVDAMNGIRYRTWLGYFAVILGFLLQIDLLGSLWAGDRSIDLDEDSIFDHSESVFFLLSAFTLFALASFPAIMVGFVNKVILGTPLAIGSSLLSWGRFEACARILVHAMIVLVTGLLVGVIARGPEVTSDVLWLLHKSGIEFF